MVAQEPLITFLHLPKTAGLTLRSILARQYPRQEMFRTEWQDKKHTEGVHTVGVFLEEFQTRGLFGSVRDPESVWFPESFQGAVDRFCKLPEAVRDGVRLFYAVHIEYGLHEYLSRPVAYFTLLRDPVERVLSHYYFSRHRRCVPEGMSLPTHIATYVEPNLQTRMLAGPPDQTAALSPDEMLERARSNLSACVVVGLTERFDETVLILRRAFGWRIPFYDRKNIGKQRLARAEIPDETLRQIEADNQLDLALYAYAKELFDAQVQQYGPVLQRDLRLFRSLNGLWRRWDATCSLAASWRKAIDERVITPAYEALARWGGLRRLVPARYAPRVAASVENDRLCFSLKMGKCMVGAYHPHQWRWYIRRPFHLFVDVTKLPGEMKGAQPGGSRKDAGSA